MATKKKHDNGVVDAPVRNKKKKIDVVMEELAEERSTRIELSKQLEEASRSESVASVEFSGNAGASSTKRQGNETGIEMAQFMTSMHQMSITSINVAECKSAVAGEQIGRRDYESWIDLLTDSLKLAGVQDEQTMFIVFKVKAGPVLLDIFKNTKSTPEAPDEETLPFSNATFRLKTYFGSASDIMLQRRKLALITQRPEESDLSFIMRVGSTAHLCDFQDGKENEEIMNAVAAHAKNKDVRMAALKMLSRQGSFTDLVDVVREIEAVAINEEYYQMKHGKPDLKMLSRQGSFTDLVDVVREIEAVAINEQYYQMKHGKPEHVTKAAVSAQYPRAGPSRRGNYQPPVARGRYGHPYSAPSRAEPHVAQGWKGFGNGQEAEVYRCYRCHGNDHKANACFAIDMYCLKCGRRGHIRKACRPPFKMQQKRRTDDENTDNKIVKVASIDVDTVAKMEDKANNENVGVGIAM